MSDQPIPKPEMILLLKEKNVGREEE
jgi:hypothetical protein